MQVNKSPTNEQQPVATKQQPVKRVELDHYSTREMELYLFFQGYGKCLPDHMLV